MIVRKRWMDRKKDCLTDRCAGLATTMMFRKSDRWTDRQTQTDRLIEKV